MKRLRFHIILIVLGLALFAGGAAMRVYAQVVMAQTEARLLQARPPSPEAIPTRSIAVLAADEAPTAISIPALGLWNSLESVDQLAQFGSNELALNWTVSDAGWHVPSGVPGWKNNVVIAGHSPSLDSKTWTHSIFRQLAYLLPGEHLELTAGKHVYMYAVDRVFAIPANEDDSPAATAWLARGNSDQLTLITCWPPHTAAFRVIVVAQPIGSRTLENKEH